jgi:hypothetical protein
MKNPEAKPISATIDWNSYLKNFDSVSKDKLIDTISLSLLQVKPGFNNLLISGYTDNGSKQEYIKTATIQIMSTPEYQLC